MIQVKRKIAFQGEAHKRRDAAKAAKEKAEQYGRIPRIAKLVALASRMQSMIESGQVESYQQLAELGRISQPRMTQIMSLLLLAPVILDLGSDLGFGIHVDSRRVALEYSGDIDMLPWLDRRRCCEIPRIHRE